MTLCNFCGYPVEGEGDMCSLACWYANEAERYGREAARRVKSKYATTASWYARKAAHAANLSLEMSK